MRALAAIISAASLIGALAAAETPKPEATEDPPIPRAAKTTENGMELFSWHVKGEDKWRFALLPAPGMDKLKTVEFVTSKEHALEGVEALKKKLAALAKNEKVGWFNMLDKRETSPADVFFDFPPKEVIKDLELYCNTLKLRLNIYQSARPKQ
ncbi:MAG TPA: hypothetical protein VKX17_21230 [Planctomycetota bacterium]|nr:hypothetical protein [Planctomycetota bacterium]